MPKGYLIDEQGIKRLREDHEILYKRVVQLEQRFAMGGGAAGAGVRITAEFAKVTTQIDQRVTTTLGKGKAELYKITKDASNVATYANITDAAGDPVKVDVYNSSLVPVPVDALIRISRDFQRYLDDWRNADSRREGWSVRRDGSQRYDGRQRNRLSLFYRCGSSDGHRSRRDGVQSERDSSRQ